MTKEEYYDTIASALIRVRGDGPGTKQALRKLHDRLSGAEHLYTAVLHWAMETPESGFKSPETFIALLTGNKW